MVLLNLVKTMVELLILDIHRQCCLFDIRAPNLLFYLDFFFLNFLLFKMNMMSEVAIVQKRQLQFIHFQHVSKVTCGPSLMPQCMHELQTIQILVAIFIGGQNSILFGFVDFLARISV